MLRSVVRGVGAYLPARIVTNDELSQRVDTSDAWIAERTGIRQRHIAAEGELTSDLATIASRRALEAADVALSEIDLVLLATATPDHTFPATATAVQRKLGIPTCIAFDIQAVCSGFTYALATADAFLKTGQARTALVIGAETFSRILDWEDRSTCVLFGDGAGAVVLRAEDQPADWAKQRGIIGSRLRADGRHYDQLYVDGGPSTTGTAGVVRMAGREVFRHAVNDLAGATSQVLSDAGRSTEELDLLVPHQANLRIIEAVGRKLALRPEQIVVTVDRHANTSAASIPLALEEAVVGGRVRQGDLVCMCAMGGGFSWGAVLLGW